MKVRCIKVNTHTNDTKRMKNEWLTVGKSYVVLSISIPNNKSYFQIVSDNNSPGLHDQELFTIISGMLPSSWIIDSDEHGNLWIGPEKWNRSNFWEDYFNDIPEAVKDFEQERKKIESESIL